MITLLLGNAEVPVKTGKYDGEKFTENIKLQLLADTKSIIFFICTKTLLFGKLGPFYLFSKQMRFKISRLQ